jgi:hypothetical protein
MCFTLYLVENSGNYGRSGPLTTSLANRLACRISGSEILEQP